MQTNQETSPMQGDLYLCPETEQIECSCGGMPIYLYTPNVNGYWCIDCEAFEPDMPDIFTLPYDEVNY